MRSYNPWDWYWKAEDGRVYSSKRRAVIDGNDDAEYVQWLKGGQPTRWPTDGSGKQSSGALSEVLSVYSISIE